MIKKFALLFLYSVLTQISGVVSAQPAQNPYLDIPADQVIAEAAIIRTNLRPTLAWRAAVIEQMLVEANYAAGRLKLPTHYPIHMIDVTDNFIAPPLQSGLPGTNRLYDIHIPREQRLRALQLGPFGYVATTNFEFGFMEGKLRKIMRLSEPNVEYYAHDLDKLVGKPSLIDTNGAYQLAMQWLAAVDVNMTALNKLKWVVSQLHYKTHGATNYVTLPLYYVDFGNKHTPASGNLKAFDKPLVSVEILGTTKELQDLQLNDLSFSRHPLLIITNALDLIRTPNPAMKHLEPSAEPQTNSPPP